MPTVSEEAFRRAYTRDEQHFSDPSHRINPETGKTGMVVFLQVHCLSCLGKHTQHLLRHYPTGAEPLQLVPHFNEHQG